MKKFLFLFMLVSVCCGVQAQSFPVLRDSCYFYLRQQDTASFNRSYVRILEAFEQQADPEMYALGQELRSMHDKDQSIRILLLDARDRKDCSLEESLRGVMNRIDRANAARVVQIIDEYGWLGSDDIGEEANDAIFLCIQHCADTTVQTKYLPILKQAVAEGAAKGWQYAFLTDRCLMNQGKPQVYGTQTIRTKNRTYVVPLQDVGRVDELRKEIGLDPLSEYMRGFGEQWSEEAYMQELPECKAAFENWYNNRK